MPARMLLRTAVAVLIGVVLAGCDLLAGPTATPIPLTPAPVLSPAPAATAVPTATLVAPLAPSPTTAPSLTPTPRPAVFEKATCPFRLPRGVSDGEDIECGYLVVQEDRADPASRPLRLAVAILRNPTKATQPDPIVYLAGGPGGSALEFLFLTYERQVTPLFATGRDVIFFDQRGVGLSKPALDCEVAGELELDLLDRELNGRQLSRAEAEEAILKAMLACQNELRAIVKLSAYNSASNAADVNDLRLALGYEQVNLWGISYGTRLALAVMRDYPGGLRSVVLDSVYPPDVNIFNDVFANRARVFDVLFAACSADAACRAAYPNLRATFFDTAARLQRTPARIKATNPLNGKSYDVLLDGETLVNVLFQMLYQSDMIPALPKIIGEAAAGVYDEVALFVGVDIANQAAISSGMYYAVQCHEEYPFTSLAEMQAAAARYPDLAPFAPDAGVLASRLCDAWGAGQAAASENQAITSSIPTLLMAGEYDPITPPAWARRAAQGLSKSYSFEYPALGHGVSVDHACPTSMMLAFIGNPQQAPDGACVAKMGAPRFIAPTTAGSVVFEPFSNSELGISGIVPKGWEEIAAGTHARLQSASDATMLFQLAANNRSTAMAQGALPHLGVAKIPEASDTYKTAAFSWRIYRVKEATVQGQKIGLSFALADANDRGYFVAIMSSPSEAEALLKVVLLPVLDALAPKK